MVASQPTHPFLYPADRKFNLFWVSFEPAKEQLIPQALLTHLLAKAETTPVGSGDTIDLKLPGNEKIVSGCMVHYTFRIRITGGVLARNTAEYICPVSEK